MRVETIDFPTDMYGEMGQLREHLVKALNVADNSVSGAKVLASTLAFAASKLREVYKEDGIKSKSREKREATQARADAKAKKAGEEVTRKAVKVARAKLIKEKVIVTKVSGFKRKTTK